MGALETNDTLKEICTKYKIQTYRKNGKKINYRFQNIPIFHCLLKQKHVRNTTFTVQ